ncbi:MAG: ABC transporter substrate-binding protein [Candidatus Rokubacteria bacterium]|nr:ABC transporter substrate-binding protein [Candidatus Rokubacteria bacterium]
MTIVPALRRLVVVALLLVPVVALAQSPAKRTIGFVGSAGPVRDRPLLEHFRRGLADLGYREGVNVVIEDRYADGHFDRLPALVTDLLSRKVDVLVVAGAPAARAAKNATTTVPIVMTNAADPVGTGLVASLARPGGNITGLSDFNEGVIAKRLALLKEVVPGASRVGVIYNPANPTNPIQLRLTHEAARSLGVTLVPLEAESDAALERALATVRRERPGALLVIGDPTLGTLRGKIAQFGAGARIPTVFSTKERLEEGGLMSYGTSFEELYRRAASYVDKVFRGAKPADLPIEQPSTFELVINLKAARALGVTVPPAVLFQADRVIE